VAKAAARATIVAVEESASPDIVGLTLTPTLAPVATADAVSASPREGSRPRTVEDDAPVFLWPATPELTPPQSPRSYVGYAPVLSEDSSMLLWPATPEITPPQSPGRSLVSMQTTGPSVEPQTPRLPPQLPSWWTSAGADSLISRLAEEHSEERQMLLDQIVSSAWPMAIRRHGCRVVQRAIEVADRGTQTALVEQFRNHVIEAIRSPHAHHVLQRCIEQLPPEQFSFILEELRGRGLEFSRHRFGCRVIERLIEHCTSESIAELLDEIIPSSADLSRHEFGNYVVQHILEYGTAAQRSQVVEILVPSAHRFAKHRVASHVVERALLYCPESDRQNLMMAMSGGKDLLSLGRTHYGSFVVRQMNRADSL